jgi:hypothetical protein
MKPIVLVEAINAVLVGAIALVAALLGTSLMIRITGISFAFDRSAPFYEQVCAVSVILWVATYLAFMRRDQSLRRICSVTIWLPLIGTMVVCGPLVGLIAYVEYCWVFLPISFFVAILIRYCIAATRQLT